ncbi:predicted protein [Chaetoceros tenuissimus]|uniref:Uncharacterized protein n=1 Tax=Chaetoceros tenuissimus TaxID=426638 RepID=A0AAD3GZE9_9STRA|nr:predicted protein [Chaetoceros tenuissimus]
MIKSIEHHSKIHGVNLEELFQDKVLSNESCFWSLLQSQTDRLHYYYYDREHKVRRDMKDLAVASAQVNVTEIRDDVTWLIDFINHNAILFSSAVRKFDSYHELNTYDDEKNYFDETYSFMDGHRLQKVLDALDIYEFEDRQKNKSNSRKDNAKRTRGSKKKRRFSVTKELIVIKRHNSRSTQLVDEKERRNCLQMFKSFKSREILKRSQE